MSELKISICYDEMKENINNLRIPFDMKKLVWSYYIRGYDDATEFALLGERK